MAPDTTNPGVDDEVKRVSAEFAENVLGRMKRERDELCATITSLQRELAEAREAWQRCWELDEDWMKEWSRKRFAGRAMHIPRFAPDELILGSPSAPAAESEGGGGWQSHKIHFDAREMAALESLAEGYGHTTWPDAIVRCKAERDSLSARLAACEERCKELEAGILAIVKYPRGHHKYCDCPLCGVTKGLCSLLAPKAEGGLAD